MRVFITGATGYIGFAVATAFARAGHHVRGLARSEEKCQQLARAEIEPVIGSLDDAASLQAGVQDCGLAIHCAVEYSPRSFELDRAAIKAITGALAASEAERRFLYTSGVWVYGDTGGRAVDETTPPAPAKKVVERLDSEALVLAANKGRLSTLVLRPGCVYGGTGSLTAQWFASAEKSGAAQIVGEGQNRWTMIHKDDLAEAYLLAAHSGHAGQVFNLTDRSRFTVRECAAAASRAAGKGGAVAVLPLEDARAKMGALADCLALDQHVDSSKATRLLGWQPRHAGFADGAERYYRAWKALQGTPRHQ